MLIRDENAEKKDPKKKKKRPSIQDDDGSRYQEMPDDKYVPPDAATPYFGMLGYSGK